MNPDSPKTPREEMEAWLTSLLLGELSAGEAAAVRELIKHDPELAKLHDDLKSTIQLVREVAVKTTAPTPIAQDQPKLSAERREKLLAQFKTIKLAEPTPRKQRIRLVELAAVLALVAAIAGLLAISAPSLKSFRSRGYSQMSAMAPEDVLLERAVSTPAAPAPAVAVFDGAGPKLKDSYFNQLGSAQVENSTVYYGISPQSGGDDFAVEAAAKKPVGMTPIPPRPSTTIVLPALSPDSATPAGQNYGVTASAANRPAVEPDWIGAAEKPGQQHSTGNELSYRYAAATPPPGFGAQAATAVDSSTGLPVAGAMAGIAGDEVDTRGSDSSGREHLRRETETLEDAFRRRYSTESLSLPSRSLRTPSVPGAGGISAGGGAGPTEPNLVPPAVLETAPNSGSLALSDTAGVRLNGVDEGKSATFGVGGQTRGATLDGVDRFGLPPSSTTSPRAAANDANRLSIDKLRESLKSGSPTESRDESEVAQLLKPPPVTTNAAGFDWYLGKPPVAGSEIVLGRAFTNSTDTTIDQLGFEVATAESLDRPATKSELRRKLDELSDDSELRETSLGLKVAEEKLATLQKDSAVSATDLEQAQKQVTDLKQRADVNANGAVKRPEAQAATLEESVTAGKEFQARKNGNAQVYMAKKRELDDMVDYQRLLTRKLNSESIDLSLPKSTQVEILERADTKTEPRQTILGGLRNAVSGDVERATRIKVERSKSDIEELNTASPGSLNPYDPYFFQSEFEIIRSETILNRVIDQLGLSKGGSNKPEAVALLRKRLDLRLVPNTSLVEIRAKADKPEEAANIANAVAEAYKQWRLDKGNELVKGGLAALEEHSREQQKKILLARAELAQLQQSLGMSDADALSPGTMSDLPIRKPSTNAPIPQPEIQTSDNNFSTFSLNVSDVSFKLAAASLEKGQMPDATSVRSEEFINAFDYRDPEPAAGAPIAFAYERARYPFAHNRDLLRFSLKTAAAGRQAGRALNIVLLLDNSGSMERADRVRIIREALRVLAGQLQPQDKLSVITFARTARLVADGISGDKASEVTEAVSGLTPEGGTNLEEAMNLGYQTAARHYVIGGINRVVVLTDGAANLGDVQPESLKQKVEDARKQGIALDCFGIGWEGFNDDLLEVLSRNGDGRYGFINSPEEAASEFAGQLAGALKVAASDVKVQVEFNPGRVTSYRQIGYAKHQLTKEQFRDNTVDAAEIAAQEAGNALYTVEVNSGGNGPLCTVRVRYKIPGTTDYREQAWDVPYTGNALPLEQSSPALRLAGGASAFSEWLVASPFAGDVSPDAVLSVLRGVPEVFGADSRPKTLEWMIRQAKSIEGK